MWVRKEPGKPQFKLLWKLKLMAFNNGVWKGFGSNLWNVKNSRKKFYDFFFAHWFIENIQNCDINNFSENKFQMDMKNSKWFMPVHSKVQIMQ